MTPRTSRRAVLAAVGAVGLAGCLGDGDSSGAAAATDTSAAATGTGADTAAGDAGGPPTTDRSLPLTASPAELGDRAVSGGPSKDGIPSIDDPAFLSAAGADAYLNPGDPVFGVARGDAVKAYPQTIMMAHEICNDELDGEPVAVTYCPLTGTAMGFRRGETTFGVSGRLVNNNLIMYDRATQTWWPQVLATSIPGPWNGDVDAASLSEFRVVWTTWQAWRAAHPETLVLSRDTGYAINYERDPYGSYNPRRGYYRPDSQPMFESFSDDDRLDPKTVVIGTRTPAGAAAFRKTTLIEEGVLSGSLDGTPLVAVSDPALETGYVYRNPEQASVSRTDGAVRVDGQAHRPDDLPLDRVLAFDAMWFAWSGFYPDTTLHG